MKLPCSGETRSRDTHKAALQVSRRSLLAFAAAVPLLPLLRDRGAWDRGAGSLLVMHDGWLLVMHDGWVLRASDLERILIA